SRAAPRSDSWHRPGHVSSQSERMLFHGDNGGTLRTRLRNGPRAESAEARMKREIVRRFAHNPILTKQQIPYLVETVHNAAVVKHDGEYIMLFRSHPRTGRSIIGLARSPDCF